MSSRELALDPWVDPWHLLGFALRILRHVNGKSLDETAERIGVVRASVSNWEHAKVRIDIEYCRTLDQWWNTGGLLELLHSYASDGRQPNVLADFTKWEQRATALRVFQATTIPGLLQTEAYARMVLLLSGARDIEGLVRRRHNRQQILSGESPPHMSILLDQRVFETAPPDIMRGQIEHLINLGDQPHVTLRIVPQGTGWYVGLVGPFHMITSARRTVVFVDAPGGGRLVKGQETGEFGTRWERISGHALPCEASRNLLVNLMEGLA